MKFPRFINADTLFRWGIAIFLLLCIPIYAHDPNDGHLRLLSPTPGSTLTAGEPDFKIWTGRVYHSRDPVLAVITIFDSRSKLVYHKARWFPEFMELSFAEGIDDPQSLNLNILPTDGSRLSLVINGSYEGAYVYEYQSAMLPAKLTAPVPGAILNMATQTFSWKSVEGALEYHIYLGTTSGEKDLLSERVGTTLTKQFVLPPSVKDTPYTLYVRLWTHYGPGGWCFNDYSFPCRFLPDFRFGAPGEAVEEGYRFSYFQDNARLTANQNPVLSVYFENLSTNPPVSVLAKSYPMEKGVGEHSLTIPGSTMASAPLSTGIKVVLDSKNAVTETIESNNTNQFYLNFKLFRCDLRFSPLAESEPEGLSIHYFVDNEEIPAEKKPVVKLYWEDTSVQPAKLTLFQTKALEKSMGEHAILVTPEMLDAAGTATQIKAVLDPDATLTELNDTNNEEHFRIPGVGVDYRWSDNTRNLPDGGLEIGYILEGAARFTDQPMLNLYWEDARSSPPSLVEFKSIPLEVDASTRSAAATYKIVIPAAEFKNAPFNTGLIGILDEEDRVEEKEEFNNGMRFVVPPRKFEITFMGMRDARTFRIEFDYDFSGCGLNTVVLAQAKINHRPVGKGILVANPNYPGPNTGSEAIEFDLIDYGVPRFKDNVVINMEILVDNVKYEQRTAIPLPLIFVGGIDPAAALFGNPHVQGGNETFPQFEQWLNTRFETVFGTRSQYPSGFKKSLCWLVNVDGNPVGFPVAPGSGTPDLPYYPTMHTLSFFGEPVDRNTVGLSQGGEYLLAAVQTMLSRTYADKVNIIAHSKGCLLTRAMLENHPEMARKVRNAILIQGPHFGSVAASAPTALPNVFPFIAGYPPDVYRNLYPLWPYYKPTPDAKRWRHPAGFSNAELVDLNKRSLPVDNNLNYTIFYTKRIGTVFAQTGDTGVGNGPLFRDLGGDLVVPDFSQRGYRFDPNNKRTFQYYRTDPINNLLPSFVKIAKANKLKYTEIGSSHVASMSSEQTFRKAWEVLWKTPIHN